MTGSPVKGTHWVRTPDATVDLRVGKVTARTGARLHLALHGLAHCGAGTGRITASTIQPLTADTATNLCRRCHQRVRTLVGEHLVVEDRRRDRGHRNRFAAVVALDVALATPDERAADEALLADLRKVLAAANEVPDPVVLTWDELQAHRAALFAA